MGYVQSDSSIKCQCTANCSLCTIPTSLNTALSSCLICNSSSYQYQGRCYSNCDIFPNTVATGSFPIGRKCNIIYTTTLTTGSVPSTTATALSTITATSTASTSTTTTTTTTTTLPLFYTCVKFGSGFARVSDGASCNCSANCAECNVYNNGTSLCVACGDNTALYNHQCIANCSSVGMITMLPGQFSTYCAPPPPTCDGNVDSNCTQICGGDCYSCTLLGGNSTSCSICTNNYYFFSIDGIGGCYENCNNFRNTNETGTNSTGRVCV